MAVSIKSEREIELMREAGKILAATHEELKEALKPGMSTWEIDRLCERIIRGYGCIPSFKNYQGFPASVCVSINDEVVHGIPRKNRFLQEGDIVSWIQELFTKVTSQMQPGLMVLEKSVRKQKN